jgi:hypothetical protein
LRYGLFLLSKTADFGRHSAFPLPAEGKYWLENHRKTVLAFSQYDNTSGNLLPLKTTVAIRCFSFSKKAISRTHFTGASDFDFSHHAVKHSNLGENP